MMFVPMRFEIKKGDQIKIWLRNNGEIEHEFVIASTADNLKHAEEMKKHPEMAHEEPNGRQLAPKKTSEMVWKFTKAGEFCREVMPSNSRQRPLEMMRYQA